MSTKNRLLLICISLLVLVTWTWGPSLFTGIGVGKQMGIVTPSPTPIPRYDMTIPYLRSQTYRSTLGPLETVGDYGAYTSFVTNYTSDGLKIHGLLTKPSGTAPAGGWPGIVFVHGYIPPKQYQTLGQPYSAYVDYLAQRGYVVFKIDLRGHGDSEGEAQGGYYTSNYVVDTLNAYAALETSGFVDPKKIGMWGHSMAGNTLLRAFAVKPSIKAVSIWAGAGFTYTDLATYGIRDASYQPVRPTNTETVGAPRPRVTNQVRALYGDPRDGNPFWKLVAASNYLSDLKGAIQLNHAVDDDVVSIEYSRNLNTLLDATAVIHEFNEFPSGGHNISGQNFNSAMDKTITFFDTYLKK